MHGLWISSRASSRAGDDPNHPADAHPCRLCRQELHADPFSGALFVFGNRGRTALRILVYDGKGFWLCHKRLSTGHFRWLSRTGTSQVRSLAAFELQVLLWNGDLTRLDVPAPWREVSPRVAAPRGG
jgi:transposase